VLDISDNPVWPGLYVLDGSAGFDGFSQRWAKVLPISKQI